MRTIGWWGLWSWPEVVQSSPTSPPSEKVKTCLRYSMSLIRRLRTKVETKDWNRDSQHQTVGKYFSLRTGRDFSTLFGHKKLSNFIVSRSFLPVESGVVSAVNHGKLDNSGSIVGIDKEK